MFTEGLQPEPGNKVSSETDLTALAEHLSVIAEALRKTTDKDRDEKSSKVCKNDLGSSAARIIEAPQAAIARRLGISHALEPTAASAFKNDSKIRRKQYGDLAREAYARRRKRAAIFGNSELFGEPAWDILLDLYVAHVENKAVSVSSACIGSAAPPTTGLRWLGVLAEHELILREHDPEDQRRVLVRLTEKGLSAMDEHFARIMREA